MLQTNTGTYVGVCFFTAVIVVSGVYWDLTETTRSNIVYRGVYDALDIKMIWKLCIITQSLTSQVKNSVTKICLIFGILKGYNLDMTDQVFASLMKSFAVQKCKAGKVIIKRGAKLKHAFLVVEGTVRVESLDRKSVTRRLTSAQKGDFFPTGWLSMEEGGTTSKVIIAEYDYIAHTDVVYLKLEKEAFVMYLKKHPTYTIELLRLADLRINYAKHRIEALVQERAIDKILHLLKYLVDRASEPTSDKSTVKITTKMTQQEIGESLGISRETTSITFRHLTEAGIIVQKGGKFLFIDPLRLVNKLKECETKDCDKMIKTEKDEVL